MSARIAIAGGGPTGLMMGRLLAADGHTVEVFEAASEIGGLCRSVDVDGYTMDVAGGHIMFTRDERVSKFWDELYADGEVCTHERQTRILHQANHFVSYPFENALGELPLQHNLECTEGTIRARLERDRTPEPDNFADWIRWKMGDGVAKHFMEPYNRKIWKADLRQMNTQWIAGRVPDAPFEDVLRASLGETTEGYTHQSVFRYPLRGGFADIHERIAEPIRDRVRLNHRVKSIERAPDGRTWLVDGQPFDHVISTIPLQHLPDVLVGMDAAAADAARRMQFRGVACYLFGIEEEVVRPYSWVYLPHESMGPTNRITYLSNYSPENAPTGKGSILAEVTYDPAKPPSVAKDGQRLVAEGLEAAGLLEADRVDVSHGLLNPISYILYDLDFEAKRNTILDHLDGLEGFHAIGRFGRYEYHNSDQCLGRAIGLHERLTPILEAGGGDDRYAVEGPPSERGR